MRRGKGGSSRLILVEIMHRKENKTTTKTKYTQNQPTTQKKTTGVMHDTEKSGNID